MATKSKAKTAGEVQKTSDKKGSAQQNLPNGWMRATFVVRETHVENLKTLKSASMGKRAIKDFLDESLNRYFETAKMKEDLKSAKAVCKKALETQPKEQNGGVKEAKKSKPS